jgi:ATP-dependent DNA ligase
VRFISRRQNSLTEKFPTLQKISKSINATVAVLDGEIVALDKNGMVRFEGLRSKTADYQHVYFAFDLLTLDGANLTNVPLNWMRSPSENRYERIKVFYTSPKYPVRFGLLEC